MLSSDNKKQLEEILKMLSEEHKLKILSFLKVKNEKSVGQIADYLGISFKATSKHLLHLSKRGILKRRYDGPFVLYKISGNLPKPAHVVISHLI